MTLSAQDTITSWSRPLRAMSGPRLWGFDFDGTLAPIVTRADKAALDRRLVPLLEPVIASGADVAIISGRSLSDLRGRLRSLPVCEMYLAGNHGLEIRAPGGRRYSPPGLGDYREELERAYATIALRLPAVIERGLIERKRYGLALHMRPLGPRHLALCSEIAVTMHALVEASDALTLQLGHEVIELRPAIAWDKGDALAWILDDLGDRRRRPCYIGDDRTDEPAFVCCRQRGGLSFRIGTTDTEAMFTLPSRRQMVDVVETIVELEHSPPAP